MPSGVVRIKHVTKKGVVRVLAAEIIPDTGVLDGMTIPLEIGRRKETIIVEFDPPVAVVNQIDLEDLVDVDD